MSKPDLLAVITHYGGDGSPRKMIQCPVHRERNPSCSVDYQKQLWKCHSCGSGGDSWSMIRLMENCTYAEAEEAAVRIGFDMEGEEPIGQHGNRFVGMHAIPRFKKPTKKYRPRFMRGDDDE